MLVYLSATRLNIRDTFRFDIEARDRPTETTKDPVKAAKLLSRVGVQDPMRAVEHVKEWGAIEVVAHAV